LCPQHGLGRVEVDELVDLVLGQELAASPSMTALSAALAPAPLLAAARLVTRRITRRRQMRVARILAQLLGQLADLLGQRRHLGHQDRDLLLELADSRVLRRDLLILRGEDNLELSDPLLRVQRPT
jgi:hypothetical protein